MAFQPAGKKTAPRRPVSGRRSRSPPSQVSAEGQWPEARSVEVTTKLPAVVGVTVALAEVEASLGPDVPLLQAASTQTITRLNAGAYQAFTGWVTGFGRRSPGASGCSAPASGCMTALIVQRPSSAPPRNPQVVQPPGQRGGQG